MTVPFQHVRRALEDTQRGRVAPQDGPLLHQLIALGLVSPAPEVDADTDTAVQVEAAAQADEGVRWHVLTADGQDVLEALGSPARWAQVREVAARQGIEVSLDTLKAAVAAAISGGFNA